jgi:CDP-6-deoxy-D-xylo-4-hexulose-3-dehydrase
MNEEQARIFAEIQEQTKRYYDAADPLTLKPGAPFGREQLVRNLNDRGIETRPVMAGTVTAHPALKLFPYRVAAIENAQYIHKHGFFWGNHQAIRDAERSYVADCVDRFVAEHT